MNGKLKVVLTATLLAGLSGTAAARDAVGFSVSVGGPGYAFNVTNSAPVYYYAPPPVYYAPAPVYYRPRAYYAPQPVVVYPRHYYYHDRHHRGQHRGHR